MLQPSLKSNYNQAWVKDAIGVPSYINEVQGHLEIFYASYVILQFSFFFFFNWVSFENVKSYGNQTWVKDVIGVPSYVNEVRGHEKLL